VRQLTVRNLKTNKYTVGNHIITTNSISPTSDLVSPGGAAILGAIYVFGNAIAKENIDKGRRP
jgi:hypothetical protein